MNKLSYRTGEILTGKIPKYWEGEPVQLCPVKTS